MSGADPSYLQGTKGFPSVGGIGAALSAHQLLAEEEPLGRLLRGAHVATQAWDRMEMEGCVAERLEGELALPNLSPALRPCQSKDGPGTWIQQQTKF